MADASVATARATDGDFRVGRVLRRSASVLLRYFLPFSGVIAVINLPVLLVLEGEAAAVDGPARYAIRLSLAYALSLVLGTLGQAAILYATFQEIRREPVSLGKSVSVGLARFFPLIALAIISGVLVGLAGLLLIIPGLILLTIWFVGVPVCVVERLGPWASLNRSDELTRGNRWKIFWLMLLVLGVGALGSVLIEHLLRPAADAILTYLFTFAWEGIWGAYYAVAVVVAYHDLRTAKEGIIIDRIAAVFD